MVRRILSCSISLCLLWCLSCPALAQTGQVYDASKLPTAKKQKEKKTPEVTYPLLNGLHLGFDLWGPGSKLLGSDNFSMEASAALDLKHRYFPTVEVGYGSTDKWNDYGTRYQSSAPYLRIGMDYNTLYSKTHGHMLLVGLRYGISPTSYDISSLSVSDPIYGGSYDPNITDDIYGGSVLYDHPGMKCTMQWLEFCLGIRAKVWKSIYMGWSMRMRYRLSASPGTYGDPSFVPGYGTYGSNTIGVTYTIIYNIPLSKKK